MSNTAWPCLIALGVGTVLSVAGMTSVASSPQDPQLAHMVFFTLKDHSKESRAAFIASCEKYLSNHEGATYFSIGTYADDVEEPGVSVKDFDVALHVVFENKAAKARYLEHPRHKQFVEENLKLFDKVRVFDSYLKPPTK
jgi:hypothetical protein